MFKHMPNITPRKKGDMRKYINTHAIICQSEKARKKNKKKILENG